MLYLLFSLLLLPTQDLVKAPLADRLDPSFIVNGEASFFVSQMDRIFEIGYDGKLLDELVFEDGIRWRIIPISSKGSFWLLSWDASTLTKQLSRIKSGFMIFPLKHMSWVLTQVPRIPNFLISAKSLRLKVGGCLSMKVARSTSPRMAIG